ncbi:MAG TPA: hypothetical protein PL070_12155 [Flavobacteriales bacterium]|nr:hypothetical protein [Flavobacteriales bacterium]
MRSLQFLSIALLWCSTTLSVAQLELGPLPATVWCSGTTMEIPYAATGTFNAGNTFIMEISDASGSFTPAIPIGSLSGTAAGVITCTMNDLSAGTGHFVRVRSTDPPLTSDPSATTLTLVAPNAGMDGFVSICTSSSVVNLFSHLSGASPGGMWTDPYSTGALTGMMLQPASLPPGSYTFTYVVEEMGCTDTATLTVVANAAPNGGANAAITVCSNDAPFPMYQSLGSNPNAGGSWTAPGGAQVSNWFDPSSDPPGVYTYTVVGEPPCANATVTLAIVVNQAPDAGANGSVQVCSSSAPFMLISHLGGTPAAGGSWSAPSPVVGGIYHPATMAPGVHTYTVMGVAPCISASATVTVSEFNAVNAGSDGFLVTCSSSSPTALIDALSGAPDAGGSWAGPSSVLGGAFDPSSMLPGTYTYTVSGTSPCPDASAAVMVLMNQAPQAGTDGSATYCTTDAAFPLVQHLGGMPSVGGTWTFDGVAHGPVFVPGTDVPGAYVYTVLGASPCGNATATVTVSQVSCLVNVPANLGIPNMTE